MDVILGKGKAMKKFTRSDGDKELESKEQFLVLIAYRDENHQVELLGRFEG